MRHSCVSKRTACIYFATNDTNDQQERQAQTAQEAEAETHTPEFIEYFGAKVDINTALTVRCTNGAQLNIAVVGHSAESPAARP